MIALFDTNILIDYLNGRAEAKDTIERYDQIAISIISYMEVMVGVDQNNKKSVEDFLNSFQIFNFDEKMADEIVSARTSLSIKLPDAIILATARKYKATLITRNYKDFPENIKGVVIPYQLEN